MLGNFSFGGNDYEQSVELWHCLLKDLEIKVDYITVHPSQIDHLKMWQSLVIKFILDNDCEWSDGKVGGYCCEVFSNGTEIGNLVNPMGHSVDVGFGWERIIMMVSDKSNVYETDLFRHHVSFVISDYIRTLECLWSNKIGPSSKGRNYICRRLLRRMLDVELPYLIFDEWLEH